MSTVNIYISLNGGSSAIWALSWVPCTASLHITPCDAHVAQGHRFQSLQLLFVRAPLGSSGVIEPSLILLNAFGGTRCAHNLSRHSVLTPACPSVPSILGLSSWH